MDRPTADLDLFATGIESVTAARDDFVRELRSRGMEVQLIHDGPTCCRMVVLRAEEGTLIDLAVNSSPLARPTLTVLGPTPAPLELAGRKLLALFDRAEARDFADVYLLVRDLGRAARSTGTFAV
ncbi:hypothetical protein KLP28_01345 [Nocardioidaceae bacterium]|nr:hypothetical protein KLP28_01345 [Nocardioidaceae bacterium]